MPPTQNHSNALESASSPEASHRTSRIKLTCPDRFPQLKRRRLAAAIVAAGALSAFESAVNAQFATGWTNPSLGNWLISTNWNLAVPDAARVAFINNGGQCLVTQAGAAVSQLYVGQLGQRSILSISPAGTLTVFGGILTVERSVLELTNGGKISVLNAPGVGQSARIFGSGGQAASARIFGPGSILSAGNLYLGTETGSFVGPASVSVEAGGRINSGRDLILGSTITVTGAGSTWQTPDYVTLKDSTLTISNGATASALYSTFANSTLNVTGSNSVYTLTAASGLAFGYVNGPGYANITAGGKLYSGAVTVGAGTYSPSNTDNSGHVTVDGFASSWTLTAGLTVGGGIGANPNSGFGRGSVTVSNGALIVAPAFDIGQNRNFIGSLELTGFNSSLSGVAFDSFVGDLGQGSVSIKAGGRMSTKRLFLGNAAGSSGLITVTNFFSNLYNDGSLYIGNAGSGTLQITNLGAVATNGNAFLGAAATGNGTAYVGGSGSTWSVSNTLAIGGTASAAAGTGTLQVYDNASVSAAAINLYATGTLEISGPVTLTGPITATGGLLRTQSSTSLSNNFTLGPGGLRVYCPADTSTTTLSGPLSGTGDLAASANTSSTTLTLTGPLTYTGNTTVSALTLVIANDGSTPPIGPGDITVNTDGALAFGRSDFSLFANHITGDGRIEHRGTGSTYLTGIIDNTGGTTITDGALYAANTGTPTVLGPGDITLNAPGALVFAREDDTVVPNNISGSGSIFHSNFGSTTLTGNLSYTGNTLVDAGALILQSPLRPITGSLIVNPQSGYSPFVSFDVPASPDTNVVVGEFASIQFPASLDTIATVRITPAARDISKAQVLVTSGISIEGNDTGTYSGLIDLGTADLIVRTAANPANSQVETLRAYLNAWTNTGGTFGLGSSSTSLAALTDPESPVPPTTLSLFVNDAGGGVPYFDSYNGITDLTADDVIIKYTYFGDTNLDGVVDGLDFVNVLEGYSLGLSGWQYGDLDHSGGEVTLDDMQAFLAALSYFQLHPNLPPLGDGSTPPNTSIPEPAHLTTLLAPATALTRRRRPRA